LDRRDGFLAESRSGWPIGELLCCSDTTPATPGGIIGIVGNLFFSKLPVNLSPLQG
jgi:hypothetical protein